MIKTGKILTIIMWVILLISGILIVSLMTNINTENDADPVMGSWLNSNLSWAYILLVVATGIILIASLYHMVTEKKSLISGLMVFGIFIVIIGISYLITSDTMPKFIGVDKFIASGTLTPKISKMIGIGLNTTYILFILAVGSIIWSSINRIFK